MFVYFVCFVVFALDHVGFFSLAIFTSWYIFGIIKPYEHQHILSQRHRAFTSRKWGP